MRTTLVADKSVENETKLNVSTRLAIERTRIAYERTMMAWVRTATSLITFGFAVYKFFEIQRDTSRANGHRIGPREFGMILVSIGLFSLLLATWENRKNVRRLRTLYPDVSPSMATFVAGLISLLGILAIVVMIFRD